MTKVRAWRLELDSAILEDNGSGGLTLKLDPGMEAGPSGLRIVLGAVTSDMLAGSIALSKLADALTIVRRDENENVTGAWEFDIAPSVGADPLATVSQVQAAAVGLDPQPNCEAKTNGDIATDTGVAWVYDNGAAGVGATLTSGVNGSYDIDGHTGLEVGDRILVADDAASNGIYEITQLGDGSNPMILTRDANFDGSPSSEIEKGKYTFVQGGVVNSGTGWVVGDGGPFVVGTDTIPFSLFITSERTAAGNGMSKTGYVMAVNPLELILGGNAQVDGDKVAILRTPANYTPDTGDAEVTDVDHLSAHLRGIDSKLGATLPAVDGGGADNDKLLQADSAEPTGWKIGPKVASANSGSATTDVFSRAAGDERWAGIAHETDTTLHLSADQNDALDGANAPAAGNVIATMDDVSGAIAHVSDPVPHITSDQNDALDGANAPDATNVLATMGDLSAALPTIIGGDDSRLLQASYEAPPIYGDASDGDVVHSVAGQVNTYTHLTANVAAGLSSVEVASVAGLSVGQEVMLHQVQSGTNPDKSFQYEALLRIIDIDTLTVTFDRAVTKTFYSDDVAPSAVNDKTQLITVPNYGTLTVNADIQAKVFDGYSGGGIALRANAIVGSSNITAAGAGFRAYTGFGGTWAEYSVLGSVQSLGSLPGEASPWRSATSSGDIAGVSASIANVTGTSIAGGPYQNSVGADVVASDLTDMLFMGTGGLRRAIGSGLLAEDCWGGGFVLSALDNHTSFSGDILAGSVSSIAWSGAGGSVLLVSGTDYVAGAIDVTAAAASLLGSDGLTTRDDTALVLSSWVKGPSVASTDAGSAAGDLLDRAAGDERWAPVSTAADLTAHEGDAVLHLTADQNDALDGATAPSASNVLITNEDISSSLPPSPTAVDDGKLTQAYYIPPPSYGDESDGAVVITPGPSEIDRLTIINTYTHMTADALTGATTISVNSEVGFAAGDEVMIHQTQCFRDPTKRFQYEYRIIDSVGTGTITFTAGLGKDFDSQTQANTGEDTKTQIIRVPNYLSLEIQTLAGVCCKGWDGNSGGILAFRTKTLLGPGDISSSDGGFRGTGMNNYYLQDRSGRGESCMGYPKTYTLAGWEPTEQSENYNAAKHTGSGSAASVTLGGSAYEGINTQFDGGGTITPYISTPYTIDGVSKLEGSDLITQLPIGVGSLYYKEDGANPDSVYVSNAYPKERFSPGNNAAAGAIACFVQDWSGFSGSVIARASGDDAGGYVAFYSETPYTGAADVSGGQVNAHGDDGLFYTSTPETPPSKGMQHGPAVETTITDDDAKVPTSGAVVDYAGAAVSHVSDPVPHLTTDQNDALDGANAPAAGNVLATVADLSGTMIQELHVVSAGEVTAGSFTLTNTPDTALGVRIDALDGVAQLHKQTTGIGAEVPDFDVLNTNEVHINNNGTATGLSESIIEGDKLLITYIGA